MADPKSKKEQVELLKRSVKKWNAWRKEHPHTIPALSRADLSDADLSGANLREANLSKVDLSGANLSDADLSEARLSGANLSEAYLDGANLREADLVGAHLYKAILSEANLKEAELRGADLSQVDLSQADLDGAHLIGASLRYAHLDGAHLRRANLTEADVSGADVRGTDLTEADLSGAELEAAALNRAHLDGAQLRGADLRRANLTEADLTGADLSGANLSGAFLIKTGLEKANLTGCDIYGISAWDLKLEGANQNGLIITQEDQPEITVGDLEVAQFIYLLLFNPKIRKIIDTVTSKVVLILGRFTEERKAVLESMREAVRRYDLVPVIFDFDKPASKDVTGAVETLARMARLVIADLTDPSSIPHELAMLVPFMRTTPVVPIRLKGSGGYSMFDDLERAYDNWVLPKYEYESTTSLIDNLHEKVLAPAIARADQLQGRALQLEPK